MHLSGVVNPTRLLCEEKFDLAPKVLLAMHWAENGVSNRSITASPEQCVDTITAYDTVNLQEQETDTMQVATLKYCSKQKQAKNCSRLAAGECCSTCWGCFSYCSQRDKGYVNYIWGYLEHEQIWNGFNEYCNQEKVQNTHNVRTYQ